MSRHAGTNSGTMATRALTPARALAAVEEFSALIAQRRHLSEVLAAVLEQVLTSLGARSAFVLLANAAGRELRLALGRHLPEDITERLRRVPLDAPMLACRAASSGQIVSIKDLAAVPQELAETRLLLEATHSRSIFAVPLYVEDRLVGVLVYTRPDRHRLSQTERRMVRALAHVFATGIRTAQQREQERELVQRLHERIKELDVLHDTSRILERADVSDDEKLRQLAALLPRGWQYPESAVARIEVDGLEAATPGYRPTAWRLCTDFEVTSGKRGVVEVAYLDEKPAAAEGPFLAEERRLIDSVAELLRAHLERRQAEEALRVSEHRFRVALSTAPIFVFNQDLDLRYTWMFNARAGFDPSVVLGKTDEALMPAEDAARVTRIKRGVLASGLGAREEVRVTIAGEPYVYDLIVEPLRESDGRLAGITGAAVDITQWKQAEEAQKRLFEALDAERERLHIVLDQLPEAVIVLDAAGQFLVINQAARAFSREWTGERDAFGNPIIFEVRLPTGEPLAWAETPLGKAQVLHEPTQGAEYVVVRGDGTASPVLVNAAPIWCAAGTFLGSVVVFQDITPLKELERLREEWTSIIAHDLRQPVTVIAGYAAILLRLAEQHAGPRTEREALEHIRAGTRRLNRLISDLLDASRLETGRLTLERSEIDPLALVREVVQRLAEVTGDHHVRVTARGQVPVVRCDPARIEQVLGNLLSNAAKYGDPGTDIEVAVTGLDGAVEIAVTNIGPGIPPEEIPNVFTRFHRTAQARLERTPGLGLGLYISKGLVEAHGGRIWVESTPRQTTTFYFTLPA